ncbi:MAG TPA: SPOR domain-containing protein [bacterium]|nr:SPOR domain-containing protein [bacterium]HMZ05160.1 SPOR domain-containing protein [bacterium]HNB10542.1 SPOR domain-containing protein [bacterium]HNB56883.1 SPOR domain-containing protein [bacterium]HND76231.1 SPOR domain-containing protein [bacterium]
MRLMIVTIAAVLTVVSCKTTQPAAKSDADFAKALETSEKNKSEKLDFLADEKLPNDMITPPDTASPMTPAPDSITYKTYEPTIQARFRVQVFAGSPSNAQKNYTSLSADTTWKKAVYVLDDKTDGKWRVWVGDFMTREEADAAKQKLIQNGYPDAWIHEMKDMTTPKISGKELFWLQIGSFSTEAAAQKAKTEAESKQTVRSKISHTDGMYKVWIGGFEDRAKADELKKTFSKAFIVKGAE